ncbi:hypothetical protein MHK_002607 [Candidatus Magnetomorum sp. HK-1]|nr:hypothetical protein MHK_002607 [Candidatus Magnetomorum sp. HK-1]
MKKKQPKTRWHDLLGSLLEYLLSPVDIEVFKNVSVMSSSPEVDILLLRRKTKKWTSEQLERLPDGIRDVTSGRILLEFKYTESVNTKSFCQALSYDYFYKNNKELDDDQVQTFLISSKTPQKKTLIKHGYILTQHPGVYKSKLPLESYIYLIVANDLRDTVYNAPIKCFASKRKEKLLAFQALKNNKKISYSSKFIWFLKGLWKHWFISKGDDMSVKLTDHEIIEMGKMWGDFYLENISPSYALPRFKPKDIWSFFKSKGLLKTLSAKERLEGLKPKERLEGLKPKERLEGLKPKERLEGLKPKERLEGLNIEDIENFLESLKKKKSNKL